MVQLSFCVALNVHITDRRTKRYKLKSLMLKAATCVKKTCDFSEKSTKMKETPEK